MGNTNTNMSANEIVFVNLQFDRQRNLFLFTATTRCTSSLQIGFLPFDVIDAYWQASYP